MPPASLEFLLHLSPLFLAAFSFPTILLSRPDRISDYPANWGKKTKLSEHHIWIWSEAHNINYSSLCTNINTGSLLRYGCFFTGLTRQHLLCITLKLVVRTFILIISSVILKRFTATLKILLASIFHVLFAVLCQQRPGHLSLWITGNMKADRAVLKVWFIPPALAAHPNNLP